MPRPPIAMTTMHCLCSLCRCDGSSSGDGGCGTELAAGGAVAMDCGDLRWSYAMCSWRDILVCLHWMQMIGNADTNSTATMVETNGGEIFHCIDHDDLC